MNKFSPPKDLTSDNTNHFSLMRKIFQHSKYKDTLKYSDSSSYIMNKKVISIGKQNNKMNFFSNDKHEVKQTLRRLRNR